MHRRRLRGALCPWRRPLRPNAVARCLVALALLVTAGAAGSRPALPAEPAPAPLTAEDAAQVQLWRAEWPRTDFSRHRVALDEIVSGGPPKDGIPPIDRPAFVPAAEADGWLGAEEPVLVFAEGADVRAYPDRKSVV